MKRYVKQIAMMLLFCLVLETNVSTVFASEQIVNEKSTKQEEGRNLKSTTNMYNLVVFARFDGDKEFVNDTIAKAGNIIQAKLVDNTYNHSTYSLKEYFKAVSNQTVNINTVYLSASASELSSFVLEKSRGYYSPQNTQNPEGYTTQATYRRTELMNDWTDKVQKAFDQGIKPKTLDGTVIDYDMLDSNGDGAIDSITVLYPQADVKYSAEHAGPLWAYQWYTGSLHVETNKGTLKSNSYFQTSLQNDPRAIYYDAEKKMYFTNAGTAIHEMGHVFGLKDLYSYSGASTPVHYMSSMAKFLSPVVQFMTAREREAAGWIEANQVETITKPGIYTLSPMKDEKQSGVMAYTLPLAGNKKLYLEYRYVDDEEVNRFDFNPTKRNLYNADGSKVNVLGLNKSGLLVSQVDMSTRFPDNSYGTPKLEVIGLETSTKVDAPRTAGEVIQYGGYTITVDSLSKEQIQFTVTGSGFEENTKPVVNSVKLVSPVEASGYYVYNMSKGSTTHFVAKVEGTNLSAEQQGVTWSVTGNSSAETKIDPDTGLLTIGPDEAVGKLFIVAATSKYNPNEYDAIYVEADNGVATHTITYTPGAYGVGGYEVDHKNTGDQAMLREAIFTREGATQIGWSLSEGGIKVYDLGEIYTEDKSLYLYPVWSLEGEPVMPPETDIPEVPSAPGDSTTPTVTPSEPTVPTVTPSEPTVPVVTPNEPTVPVVTPSEPTIPAVTPSEPPVPIVTPNEPTTPTVTPNDPQETTNNVQKPTQNNDTNAWLASITTAKNFERLKARSEQQTKYSIKLQWEKVSEADGYIIYGCKSNSNAEKQKMKTIKTLTSNQSINWVQKKLNKGTYYTYQVKAYRNINGKKRIIATSEEIYVSTLGSKYGGTKQVRVTKIGKQNIHSQNNIKFSLKRGATAKILVSEVMNASHTKNYKSLSYESSNKKIAKVSKNGTITAAAKGTCEIYIYAQNGVYRTVTVTVK